jgi:aspartyl-tRNA(Asn)/glutamyl-tRNA(Gln) amidotransferase subunit B
MPGVLPVINQQAVAHAVKVGLALDCQVATTSIFARKNYFYPDLPKGYQISQYEYPLAEGGKLRIHTSQGERDIRIRRVHMEEDTGKLTHVPANSDGSAAYSLVDLNRAGVPLLEIVSEPDMHTIEEVRAYAQGLRAILRYLGVNSGDMEKGVIRFEANVSVRPVGSQVLGTRVEIKNLNSFRALERSSTYQIQRQIEIIEAGGVVYQETLGWNEALGETYTQRSKEEAHDYRYFPEPDLPPLVIEQEWIDQIAASLPELPKAKAQRFQEQYGLAAADAALLVEEQAVAAYFEAVVAAAPQVAPRVAANWLTGEIFGWLNQSGHTFAALPVTPEALAELLNLAGREINLNTAKTVLAEMLASGQRASEIVRARGLSQISDTGAISSLVAQVLAAHPAELASFLAGKETLSNWFFGQVMREAKGQANPQVLRAELERQLSSAK